MLDGRKGKGTHQESEAFGPTIKARDPASVAETLPKPESSGFVFLGLKTETPKP